MSFLSDSTIVRKP